MSCDCYTISRFDQASTWARTMSKALSIVTFLSFVCLIQSANLTRDCSYDFECRDEDVNSYCDKATGRCLCLHGPTTNDGRCPSSMDVFNGTAPEDVPDFKPECVWDSDCKNGDICTYDMECQPLAAVYFSCNSNDQCYRKTPLTLCNDYHFCSCPTDMNFNGTECVDRETHSYVPYRPIGRSTILPAVLGTAALVLTTLGLCVFVCVRRYKRSKAATKSQEKEQPPVFAAFDDAGPLPPKTILV